MATPNLYKQIYIYIIIPTHKYVPFPRLIQQLIQHWRDKRGVEKVYITDVSAGYRFLLSVVNIWWDFYIFFLLMTLIFWNHCFKYLNNKVIEVMIDLR